MPRILLIGNYPPDRQHSMLRYARWLARALPNRGLQADLLWPPERLGRITRATHPLHKWLGYLDKFLLFPLSLLRVARRYDLIHICDHSNAPYRWFARGVPVLVTCHDLIAIKAMLGEYGAHKPGPSGRLLQKWIVSSLKSIETICCVSGSTRGDVIRLVHPSEARTIQNPVIEYSPMAKADAEAIVGTAGISPSQRYLLHVGGNLWYKNRIGVIELFALLVKRARLSHLRLVCAGAELSREQKAAIVRLGIAGRVDTVTSPSENVIRALYCNADGLLFISLEEGFGWPIIEAQACGCPVITTDREPMKSIAGPPAVTVDPSRLPEAAERIDQNWDWLMAQRDASIANAARFSERPAIDEYIALYDSVLNPEKAR